MQEKSTVGLSVYDIQILIFFTILFFIVARDSYLIYLVSIRQKVDRHRKSIAITHLLAWQFWALGTLGLRLLAEFTISPVYFGLSFVLLLVPLITIGSRPFDWVREGHDPIMLLLVDQYGTPSFSWTKQDETPLLMEGSSIATVNDILENFSKGHVTSMVINFHDATLYTHSSNGYLSILLTSGNHKSFEHLLGKIHQILVTNVVQQSESGIPGHTFPKELQWLLNQLIPDFEKKIIQHQTMIFEPITN